ncbi:SAM-dependent methyltransferase [Streptomyces sp. NPDC058459]|uniref:SAM-dependent methyltransferase n=1 Tax=Streptomyces sp. NPDC058459 TaxID=3346508 RepID=UPI00365EFBD9
MRERADVEAFCAPLDLEEPGLTEVSAWRPRPDDVPSQQTWEWEEYGGMGFVRR